MTKMPVLEDKMNHHFRSIVVENKIYVIGGKSSYYSYNTELNIWTKLADLSQPQLSGEMVAIDSDRIWLIGGIRDLVEEYSISKNKWKELDWRLPEPCAHMVVAFDQNKGTLMIVSGSCKSGNNCKRRNADGSWTILPDLPTPIYHTGFFT